MNNGHLTNTLVVVTVRTGQEVRCSFCGKLIAENLQGELKATCPRCKIRLEFKTE